MATEEDPSDFAVIAAREVAGAACNLALTLGANSRTRETSRILGNLGAILGSIAYVLQDDVLMRQSISHDRFRKFLGQLETVCTWPTRPGTSYPVLTELRRQNIASSYLYPYLTAFATSKSKKKEVVLVVFDRFLPEMNASLKVLYPNLKPVYEKPIPDKVIQQLYRTIEQNSLCRCGLEKSARHYQGRLRLRAKADNNHADGYLFDTMFCGSMDMHESAPLRWQLMRFHIPTTGVTIVEPHDDMPLHQEVDRDDLLAVQNFCHLVQENLGIVKICFRIQGNQLLKLRKPAQLENTEFPVQPLPSHSLHDILRSQYLTTHDRLVVAYILARSVWEYYNSDWLSTLWTTGDIHFMMEEREDHRPGQFAFNPALPYLAFTNHDRIIDSILESVTCDATHNYPRILALGVILIELCRKEPLRNAREHDTLNAFINNSLHYSLRTIRNDASWPHLKMDLTYKTHFKDAVSACFDWKRLDELSSNSESQTQAYDKRRELLWNEVVSPLHQICRILKLIDESGTVIYSSSHVFGPATSHESLDIDDDIKGSAIALNSQLISQPADDWMNNIRQSRFISGLQLVTRRSGGLNPNRVRIAILDTGYDSTHSFFDNFRRRIVWRDFIEDSDHLEDDNKLKQGRDSNGHGTDVLSLALRLAPFAEFYVARIFENSADLASRVDKIVQAINWAVKDCNVDMVSMSFGFRKDQPLIREAIQKAQIHKQNRILFFAAAANEGAEEPEMYPARDDNVFGIRATDHEGNWWPSNPPVQSDLPWRFMTLGKNIPAVTHDEYITGTSYATPIAASIAAMILADARRFFHASEFEVHRELLDKLSRKDGMRAIFMKISIQTTHYRCSYLSPKMFINKDDEGRRSILRSII